MEHHAFTADGEEVEDILLSKLDSESLAGLISTGEAEEEEEAVLQSYVDEAVELKGVRPSRGFECFPFGLTAYRQTTLGHCLMMALNDSLISCEHDDGVDDDGVDDDSDGVDDLIMASSLEDESLMSIMDIFDRVICRRIGSLIRTHGRNPRRVVTLKALVKSFKVYDNHWLAYLQNANLSEMVSSISGGMSISSPSLKLVLANRAEIPQDDSIKRTFIMRKLLHKSRQIDPIMPPKRVKRRTRGLKNTTNDTELLLYNPSSTEQNTREGGTNRSSRRRTRLTTETEMRLISLIGGGRK